jgi:hypothetical protein
LLRSLLIRGSWLPWRSDDDERAAAGAAAGAAAVAISTLKVVAARMLPSRWTALRSAELFPGSSAGSLAQRLAAALARNMAKSAPALACLRTLYCSFATYAAVGRLSQLTRLELLSLDDNCNDDRDKEAAAFAALASLQGLRQLRMWPWHGNSLLGLLPALARVDMLSLRRSCEVRPEHVRRLCCAGTALRSLDLRDVQTGLPRALRLLWQRGGDGGGDKRGESTDDGGRGRRRGDLDVLIARLEGEQAALLSDDE